MNQQEVKGYTRLFFMIFFAGFVVAFLALASNYSFVQKSLSDNSQRLKGFVQFSIARYFPATVQNNAAVTDQTFQYKTCTNTKSIANLDKTTDPTLQRLAQLQSLCSSLPAKTAMVFTTMPNSVVSADFLANNLATTLKEFDKYGITPLVVVEPSTSWGLIDFNEFGSGFYNTWIDEFFVQLKNDKITDAQMGIWVPFPEANLPYWNKNNSAPEQVGKNIVMYDEILRRHFPTTELSILLNSVSYANADYNWENGTYTSLIPYIKSIKPGLITSFGIQGFPWRSPANVQNPLKIYDPTDFLGADLAIEAANYLGVKKIWINTGTFRTKYAGNPDLMVTETSQVRSEILQKITDQGQYLQSKGFTVAINLFSEDKSQASEATDWSYWGNTTSDVDANTIALLNFIGKLNALKIDFWYYDKAH